MFTSLGMALTNAMGIIIFDMMHAPDGQCSLLLFLDFYSDSGVGDHGEKGIEKWRDQHDCNILQKS
jgi:hypothetical protein